MSETSQTFVGEDDTIQLSIEEAPAKIDLTLYNTKVVIDAEEESMVFLPIFTGDLKNGSIQRGQSQSSHTPAGKQPTSITQLFTFQAGKFRLENLKPGSTTPMFMLRPASYVIDLHSWENDCTFQVGESLFKMIKIDEETDEEEDD